MRCTMEEKKDAPITTETQIEDWVNACRFEFRKIMADPGLQKKALKNNSSDQDKNYPFPEELSLNKDQIKLYSAAMAEASAKMMESHGYIEHFSIQPSTLSQSESQEDQDRGLKLSDEGRNFAQDHLFPMFDKEIRMHEGLLEFDTKIHTINGKDIYSQMDIYKELAKIKPPSIKDWENIASELFKKALGETEELLKAFNARESIDRIGQAERAPLKINELNTALSDLDLDEPKSYKFHDTRTGTMFQGLNIDKTDLKTSEILIYEAIVFHIKTELFERIKDLPTKLGRLQTTEPSQINEAIEKQLLSLKQLRDRVDNLPIFKTLIESEIQFSKTLNEMKTIEEPNAKTIRVEVIRLHKNNDPNFTVPELTKILQGVQNKKTEYLLNAAKKIQTSESKTQNYQQLKTGLIIFSASCLIVAAAAATLFSFGILAPITLPLMAVAGSLLVGAVGTLGYKSNEYKNTMSALRKELTQELKELIEPAEKKQSSVAEGRESPVTVTEDFSPPSTPKFGGSR